jgi:hypothetical protein
VENYNCDVCKFLVQYSNGKDGIGRVESQRCCRYPVATKIDHPDNHKCGEGIVDLKRIDNIHRQEMWKLEASIVKLRRHHKTQVAKLKVKYKELQGSIENVLAIARKGRRG